MAQKKTHEQFVEELKLKNPNVEVLGEYVNAKTKIKCRCLKDGYEWDVIPDGLLRGKGCHRCAGTVKYTNETFQEKLKNINTEVKILGEYVNVDAKIKVKCLKDDCGFEWETTPYHLLSKKGCPRCAKCERYTTESFKEKLKTINPNIELLGKYISTHVNINCKCLTIGCDHEWLAAPSNLLKGTGCPKCAHNMKYTTETFKEKLKTVNPNIEILDDYVNNHTNMKCKCKIDNYVWMVTGHNLLRGKKCPRCVKRERYTTESFKEKLKTINLDISIIGDYYNTSTKIKCKCLKNDCGHIWDVEPEVLLQGTGCPKCKISHGERKISNYLSNNNISYIPEHKFPDCKHKRELPFDFYIPDLNIIIEYDGEHHYRPVSFGSKNNIKILKYFEATKLRDSIKNDYCVKNNIKLLRIPYFEFDNIETILDNYLFSNQ